MREAFPHADQTDTEDGGDEPAGDLVASGEEVPPDPGRDDGDGERRDGTGEQYRGGFARDGRDDGVGRKIADRQHLRDQQAIELKEHHDREL